ncbi:MAG: hypothetical protein V4507_08095 [Verrucomicrobiota bacterium]
MSKYISMVVCLGMMSWLFGVDEGKIIPPPSAPFVVIPVNNISYTMEIGSAADTAPASSPLAKSLRIKKIEVSQSGNIRRDQSLWSDGTQTEDWYVDEIYIYQDPRGWITSLNPKTMSSGTIQRRDASDYFKWLSLDNYKKIVLYEGKKAYQYSENDQTAWIDVTTLFPLAYQRGTETCVYRFKGPFPEELVLPKKYKAELDKIR